MVKCVELMITLKLMSSSHVSLQRKLVREDMFLGVPLIDKDLWVVFGMRLTWGLWHAPPVLIYSVWATEV